jgi:enediyne biosynthesis protein E4
LLKHTHHEDPFDDYARQPLLPKRLSQLGPGVAWFDLDGDGRDDLIVGSGRGGQLGVFRNDGQGGFKRWPEPPLTLPLTRDQTTVLGWQKTPGQIVVLVGSANYEDGLTNGSVVRQFDLARKMVQDRLPGQISSTGPLAMADLDGDGNLDLFVGGRVIPGRYPEAASSLIFRAMDGEFVLDQENTKRLEQVGLVSGAVWSDLDGDGFAELILACEWGPLRIFHNERGKLAEATEQLGLARFKGWWNGVTTGDFDGDGKLDIVASNWGRNSRYESHRARPLRIYYGDLNGDGTLDIIEAWHDPQMDKLVPVQTLDVMAKAMPFLRERFTTHQAYGEAGVAEVFGARLETAAFAEAVWIESTVFLNRSDHFEAKALPVEAQMAPAFALCVGDFDGNGNEDLFLSQNFFAVTPETPRYDAGRGLWLRGDGHGGFSAVPGQESGVKIYGEQRGAALSDYDGDGRVDLVVTQNGAETKLYHNHGAKPGLRVRLSGPPGNLSGVGATMRLIFGPRSGPAREVHAGSGYWSQDSPVQVLATPVPPTQLWVRWPGGKVTTSDVPPAASEVQVNQAGEIKTTFKAASRVK